MHYYIRLRVLLYQVASATILRLSPLLYLCIYMCLSFTHFSKGGWGWGVDLLIEQAGAELCQAQHQFWKILLEELDYDQKNNQFRFLSFKKN